MPATIRDVARAAGVSASTVSRALTVPDIVSPATRAKVQAAADRLGYAPNRAARGLITGRTGNLGLVVPDLANPFFPSLVKTIQARARAADIAVFLADTDEDAGAEGGLVRRLVHTGRRHDPVLAASHRGRARVVRPGDQGGAAQPGRRGRRGGDLRQRRRDAPGRHPPGRARAPADRLGGRPGHVVVEQPACRRPGRGDRRGRARAGRGRTLPAATSTAGWRQPTRCSRPARPR